MERIVLRTRDDKEVATIEVPPFTPPAEVIVWGQRFFVLVAGDPPDATPRYREGMAWFAASLVQP